MKKMMAVMTFLMIFSTAAWAQEPSNTELYQMIKAMEQKFNEALDQTNQALAEAQKAKQEAAVAKQAAASAREEAARAKAELAQFKAAVEAAPAPSQPLLREAESVPGLGASLEAVYLRPSRSDLDYVIVDTSRTGNVRGSYKEVEPGYSAGARMGLSYDVGTGTAIRAQYLTLDTSDSSSAEKEAGVNDLWGTWLHPNAIIDDNDVTSAQMSYDFNLDVFDLSARKKLDMGSDLGLGIEAGLRYARIDQKIEVNYRQDVTSTTNRRADIYNTNNFSGWGPRFGVDADWRMGKGFSLFGALAGSILLGDFDTSQQEYDWQVAAVTPTTRVDVENTERNRVVPVLEMRAGLGYAYQLENGMSIGAKAGYEWQNWFNMVTATRYMDDVDSQLMYTDTTDVSLDGFFLEGFINF